MRRAILFAAAALLLLLTGCGTRNSSPAGTWQLESAADGTGETLEDWTDITCTLTGDGSLTFSGDFETSGTYTAQTIDSETLRLEAATEDGSVWVGTYGVRSYQDGSTTPVLLLSSEDYILSFLPEE